MVDNGVENAAKEESTGQSGPFKRSMGLRGMANDIFSKSPSEVKENEDGSVE